MGPYGPCRPLKSPTGPLDIQRTWGRTVASLTNVDSLFDLSSRLMVIQTLCLEEEGVVITHWQEDVKAL